MLKIIIYYKVGLQVAFRTETGIAINNKKDLIINKVKNVAISSKSPIPPIPLIEDPINQTITVIKVLIIASVVILFFIIANIKDIKNKIEQIKIPISSAIIDPFLKAFPFDYNTSYSHIKNVNIKIDNIKRIAIKHPTAEGLTICWRFTTAPLLENDSDDIL